MSKKVLFSMCFTEGMDEVLASMHVGTTDGKPNKVPVLSVDYESREQVLDSITSAINIMLDRFEESLEENSDGAEKEENDLS